MRTSKGVDQTFKKLIKYEWMLIAMVGKILYNYKDYNLKSCNKGIKNKKLTNFDSDKAHKNPLLLK